MSDIKILVEQSVGKIDFNYAETKAFLQEKMAVYNGAVFTNETMDIAKKERASLRKLKMQMDEERKKVKIAWMAPYTQFESHVKELIELVDKPVLLIDKQVKEYETRKREEKLEVCKGIFAELVDDLTDFLTFEKIFDAKWLNATTTLKSIREDIQNIVAATETQIETIKMSNSDAVEKALEIYRDTLDITRAIGHINQYETTKREVEERERKRKEAEEQRKLEAERARIREEERQRILEEQKKEAETEIKIQQAVEEAKVNAEEEIIQSFIPEKEGEKNLYEYRIELSGESKEKLEMFMDSIGIEWELI